MLLALILTAAIPNTQASELLGTYRSTPECREVLIPRPSPWGDGRPATKWIDLAFDRLFGSSIVDISFPADEEARMVWTSGDHLSTIEARSGKQKLRSGCYFMCTEYKAAVDVDEERSVLIERRAKTFIFWGTVMRWEISRTRRGARVQWKVDEGHLGLIEGSCDFERVD